MATIRKHRGKWQAIVRRKGQGSASKTFHIRRDAERWARDQERKLDNGTFGKLASQEVTLAELLIRYRDTITETKKGAPQEKRRIQILPINPPLMSLAGDISLTGFPLGIKAIEVLLQAFLCGFTGIDGETYLKLGDWCGARLQFWIGRAFLPLTY